MVNICHVILYLINFLKKSARNEFNATEIFIELYKSINYRSWEKRNNSKIIYCV